MGLKSDLDDQLQAFFGVLTLKANQLQIENEKTLLQFHYLTCKVIYWLTDRVRGVRFRVSFLG